jgi:glutathione S-transferase
MASIFFRRLFSWWCTLVFRPEGPATAAGASGASTGSPPLLSRIMGGGGAAGSSSSTAAFPHASLKLSSSMRGFLDCVATVNDELLATTGPWFFDDTQRSSHPTMIDFIFVSHVERMLASCAYWKGLNLRDPQWNFQGLTAWLEAFEKREPYLAFTSDYYTHVMDIPPQYGPGYDGGFDEDRRRLQKIILGRDGTSWNLPLPFDDPLQPLYKGPPLPLSVLDAAGLEPGAEGTYESCDPAAMERACRSMAAWKLAGNGQKVAAFAARGGPKGSKNPRKSFGAQLADPYAEPDASILPSVDAALRIVNQALLDLGHQRSVPDDSIAKLLRDSVPDSHRSGVASSLAYVRDRVGVPRDLPLAAARYLRAYLNWAIDALSS